MASPKQIIPSIDNEMSKLNISSPNVPDEVVCPRASRKRKSSSDESKAKKPAPPALPSIEQLSRTFARTEPYEDDMDGFVFDLECDILFSRYYGMSSRKIELIERRTMGQSANDRWREESRIRLNACHFGRVVKMGPTTHRSFLVEEMLSSLPLTPKSTYLNCAILAYMDLKKLNVDPCGLFVHREWGFLCASPDGLLGPDGILVIKCPYSHSLPLHARGHRRHLRRASDEDGPKVILKKTHNYYYQIQGQLEITDKKFCDFVIWNVSGGITHIQRVSRDPLVWSKMFPKLKDFYIMSLLPELVDSRYARGLPIREPDFVLDAIEIQGRNTKKL